MLTALDVELVTEVLLVVVVVVAAAVPGRHWLRRISSWFIMASNH